MATFEGYNLTEIISLRQGSVSGDFYILTHLNLASLSDPSKFGIYRLNSAHNVIFSKVYDKGYPVPNLVIDNDESYLYVLIADNYDGQTGIVKIETSIGDVIQSISFTASLNVGVSVSEMKLSLDGSQLIFSVQTSNPKSAICKMSLSTFGTYK